MEEKEITQAYEKLFDWIKTTGLNPQQRIVVLKSCAMIMENIVASEAQMQMLGNMVKNPLGIGK